MLSPKELDVLIAYGDGLTASTVAERLGITVSTVKKHQENIRRKLGAKTVTHALALAYVQGLIVPSDGFAVGRDPDSTPAPAGATLGP